MLSINIQNTPNWVTPYPINTQSNLELLMLNNQCNVDSKSYYTQKIHKLHSTADLQKMAKQVIHFNADYENVVIHSVKIYRDRNEIDKTQTARYEIIKTEEHDQFYIHTNRMKIFVFLDDLQKGDILEFSYSTTRNVPCLKGFNFFEYSFQSYTPIGNHIFRVVASKEMGMEYSLINTSFKPECETLPDGTIEWVWNLQEVPRYKIEPDTPDWFNSLQMVQFYNAIGWKDVCSWGCELFTLPKTYSNEMHDLVKSWKLESSNLEEMILKALHFVQDDIYYLGFEIGDNNFQPHDPNLVLEKRYGDCKDKTQLLRALLDVAGIKSSPVLVNTNLQEHITDSPPSPTRFNHAILQIQFNDQVVWVDPTLSLQGGSLRHVYCPSYGKGLVLQENEGGILSQPQRNSLSKTHSVKSFDCLNEEADSTIEWVCTFYGRDADLMRSTFLSASEEETAENVRGFLADDYGELEDVKQPQIHDDRLQNELKLTAQYRAKNLWNVTEGKREKTMGFDYYPKRIVHQLSLGFDKGRKQPLRLPHPTHVVEEFYIKSPCEIDQPFENYTFETDELLFKSQSQQPNKMQLHHCFEMMTKTDYIPEKTLSKNMQVLNEIHSKAYYTFHRKEFLPDQHATDFINYISATFFLISFCYFAKKWLFGH